MNNLQIFENEEFGQVRTVTIDGEPWFVGKDVARALGYGEGKSLNNAVANHVDDEDKGVTEMMTLGGKQNFVIINESGLYSLIFGSKLKSAKRFKHWVTSEVLPALRKTGHYEMPGVGAYDAKATSVGEIVNLLLFTKKSMEKRGCGQQEIAEVSAELCSQFNIHMPKSFLVSPDVPEKKIAFETGEEETFEEYIEELKVAAWERKGRSMVTCRQFNDFCAGHGISARKFRKWLYQNGYIMASDNHGKINYSMTIWKDGGNTTERCIVFKEI
ncbi:MAG: Bro-N domain-containing protein [Lachnospiraceae bacterium]|nr:Bro-N domain-containing protein [Lachnospiraceae bacterium]